MNHIKLNHLKENTHYSSLEEVNFNKDFLYIIRNHKDESLIVNFFNFFKTEVLKIKKEYNADIAFSYKAPFMHMNDLNKNTDIKPDFNQDFVVFLLTYNYGKINLSSIKFHFGTDLNGNFSLYYKINSINQYKDFKFENYSLFLLNNGEDDDLYFGENHNIKFLKSKIHNFSEEDFVDDFLKTINNKKNNNHTNF
tara:strand:- start:1325 stop:1909 length:585 start_codon:yes stop_codon:yes gene_type:complete